MYVSIGVLYQLDNSKEVNFTDAFGWSSVRDESVHCIILFFLFNKIFECPYCHSINTSKIGTVNRAVSVGMFGLASSKIGKTHKCNDCGSTW